MTRLYEWYVFKKLFVYYTHIGTACIIYSYGLIVGVNFNDFEKQNNFYT